MPFQLHSVAWKLFDGLEAHAVRRGVIHIDEMILMPVVELRIFGNLVRFSLLLEKLGCCFLLQEDHCLA